MTPTPQPTVIGLVALAIGLGGGYVAGANVAPSVAPQAHQMSDGSLMHGTSMEASMQGMAMGLEGKSGTALEKAFLDEMIVHHRGAIDMAQTLLKGTNRPELVKLAHDIITAQTGEIALMQKWRLEWFGTK